MAGAAGSADFFALAAADLAGAGDLPAAGFFDAGAGAGVRLRVAEVLLLLVGGEERGMSV